ncbi:hypothetical protein EJ110_NYTH09675 [Nymphaea thermarum]|nr:hypothetical protein EJ110_NYTH09675 [Nymphaea thermarum]
MAKSLHFAFMVAVLILLLIAAGPGELSLSELERFLISLCIGLLASIYGYKSGKRSSARGGAQHGRECAPTLISATISAETGSTRRMGHAISSSLDSHASVTSTVKPATCSSFQHSPPCSLDSHASVTSTVKPATCSSFQHSPPCSLQHGIAIYSAKETKFFCTN